MEAVEALKRKLENEVLIADKDEGGLISYDLNEIGLRGVSEDEKTTRKSAIDEKALEQMVKDMSPEQTAAYEHITTRLLLQQQAPRGAVPPLRLFLSGW